MTAFEDSFSEEVWKLTYKYYKDDTIDDTLMRVANAVASVENTDEKRKVWAGQFYDMLSDFKVTTGGRIMANAGTEFKGTTLMNCVAGETPVHTDTGVFEARTLVGKTINVLSKDSVYRPAFWSCYGNQRLYKIILSNDDELFATKEHEWVVSKPKGGYEKVKTTDLKNHYVPVCASKKEFDTNITEFKKGIQHGLIFGDGWVYMKDSKQPKSMMRQFGDSMHLIEDYFDDYRKVTNNKSVTYYEVKYNPIEYKTELPKLTDDPSYIRGFISGFIAADGTVDKRGTITLFQSSKEILEQVRKLATQVGIPTGSIRIYRDADKGYCGKISWALSFIKQEFPKELIIKNSHIENYKISPKAKKTYTFKVVDVQPTNRFEPVYCCVEPETHTMVIGNNILTGQCFVLPAVKDDPDSLEGILKKLRYQAITLKSEGGVGFNCSILRPRGSFIDGIGVETPGAVKFAELFDKSSEIITAGSGLESSNKRSKGKIRKGAQMLICDIWHPDIIEFITAKQTPGKLTKFNMSVNCTDKFMNKIIEIEKLKEQLKLLEAANSSHQDIEYIQNKINAEDIWELIFPDTYHEAYKSEWDGNLNVWLDNNYPVKVYKTISASWLWNLIMESTYNRAEPGVIFLDRANDLNPMYYNKRDYIDATNPCGEQVLPKAGVCNLASINLTQFINEDRTFDFEKLKKYVPYAVRFLDNVNDLTGTPLPEYREYIDSRRRIGLGIMGWGSLLYMMGIRFGSSDAETLKKEIMRTFNVSSIQASIDLAKEKGMFPACEPLKHAEGKYFKQIGLNEHLKQQIKQHGIRNSTLYSMQPTGNTSVFANVVSGGIEPIFISEYIRTVIVSTVPENIKDVTPKWYEGQFHETEMFKLTKEGDEEILRGISPDGIVYKIDRNRGLTKEVECEDYGVRWLKKRGLWDVNANWAVCTQDLTAEEHIFDLKGFALWTDSSLSKTINLPYDYTFDNFKNIYMDAYKTGYIKGLTTYRAGTMTSVLSAKEEKDADASDEEIILDDVKLPSSSPAIVKKIKSEGKKWYLTVILDEEQKRPFALFVQTNSIEKTVTTVDAIDKLLDLARSKGIKDRHIEDTQDKMAGEANAIKIARMISLLLRHGVLIKNIVRVLDSVDVPVTSFLFNIKKFLSQYIKDGEKIDNEVCDSCGAVNTLVYSEGCVKCSSCGNSKCG